MERDTLRDNAPAIRVEELKKHYGPVRAVDGISFEVRQGEIFGLLGHNGAGKTTTIRVLTGRTRPTSGRASIAGYDIVTERDRVKPLINLVFEQPNLYERLTGRDNLLVFADLYGVEHRRVDELLEMVGLTDAADRRVKDYSSGMAQRLLLVRAMINNPSVLFLDEPTRGLDPAAARDIRNIIAGMSQAGTTVFLTTHYMEEADELCDRVAFISEGKIVALDTPQELKLRHGKPEARVTLDTREEVMIRLDRPEDAKCLESWMVEGRVLAIHSQEGTLEDVFIALAGRELR